MFKDILLVKKKNMAILTLNRPEVLNAFSLEMRQDIGQAFQEISEDDDIRALIITGAGRAFSAGGDMKSWGDSKDTNIMKTITEAAHRAVTNLIALEKPVIAMVNGDAIGAGCNLALACDLVIASENARFGEVFVKVGLGPDWGGAYLLPRLVGLAKAKELIFTGKIISAKEACEIGLINRVVSNEDLEMEVMKLAEKLSNMATKAIGMGKTFLHKAWNMDIDEVLEYEAQMQSELMKTTDHQNAVKSFLNKRKPVFNGK